MEVTTDKTKNDKATKPGFKPASRLGHLIAPKGFTARWVRNDSDNIARKKAEGWIIMKPEQNKGTYVEIEDVNDTKPTSNQIRYRDLIGMMLPDDMVESRREYYKNETLQATKSILKKSDEGLKQLGATTYTPKGQSGRIVIE